MRVDYRVYRLESGEAPPDKAFFCLPWFLLDGKMRNAVFIYGATAEEAERKAREFWDKEIAKARANRAKTKSKGAEARGRPESTAVTPEMLAKIDDDFDPKG